MLSVQDLGFCSRQGLLRPSDSRGLGIDQALNLCEYLGDEGVVGAQEIDLFERLLFCGSRLFPLATEVADVLCRSRDDQRDDESDDGGKSEPGLQREHGETTHGVRPAE